MDFKAARDMMVDTQIRPDGVTEPAIVNAFLRTPREAFVPNSRRSVAYSELEIETSPRRALWIPRDTAKLIKLAEPKSTDLVLVIGAGAGYEAAIFNWLTETVLALEEEPALVDAMATRFAALGLDRAAPVSGALAIGLPDQAPFNIIFVCGMIASVPASWGDQLAEGGRLAAVVSRSGALGRGTVFTKSGTALAPREGFDACPPRFTAFDPAPGFVF